MKIGKNKKNKFHPPRYPSNVCLPMCHRNRSKCQSMQITRRDSFKYRIALFLELISDLFVVPLYAVNLRILT
jgi:hypothetical protein